MSKASFNIFNELSAWGETLPSWQRCLLAKLVGAVELSDEAVDEVLAEYLIDQGLLVSNRLRQAWDIALPHCQSHAPSIAARMTAMTGVFGVNALAAGETLTFGPKLTVVYGPNGTGKSGYARVLKAACFTRSKETEILGNVRLDKYKQPKPRATFTFDDDSSTMFTYQEPCPRMRDNFAVFDSSCVRVHLDERNAFQVMPYLFDVFPRMVEAFGRLQSKLKEEIGRRSPAIGKFAIPDGRSQVAKLLECLTAQTDLNALKALAVFGENESVRLEDVRRQLIELRTTDPKEIINRNEQRIRDLDSVKASLVALVASVTPKLVEASAGAIGQVRQLVDKAAALSAAQFGHEPVQPVGTAAWRELLSAAVAYNAEAYPGDAFPPKAAGARCVLCHQPLNEGSSDRLTRFYQVVTSDVEAQLRRARMVLQANREGLSKLNVAFFVEQSAVRRTLREMDAALESDVVAHVASFRSIIKLLIQAAETVTEPAGVDLLDDTLSQRISAIAERLKQENESLRLKDPKTLIEGLSAEEQLLIDRKRLSGQYEEIAAGVADLQWVAKANACIRSFPTTQRDVTTKQKGLAKELVAQGFIARFADNCASLQLKLPVQFRFAGDAGTTDRQIEIASASGVDPSDVLSEGEQTAVALGDFLTEVELSGSCAGVVFDDPVSSMDHVRKEAIARRLVDEATRRQVIVFTHDILFTDYLATAGGEKGVQFAGRTVCRGEKDEPGAIDRLAFPHEHYEGAAYDRAKKHLDAARAFVGDAQRDGLEKACGSLRTAYEDFIQKKLFNNVIRRWRENITFMLDQVLFDEGIAARVQERMEKLSRYIDAHSHSPDFHEVPLTIDMVANELAQFERIKADYSSARKAWEKAKLKDSAVFS